MKRIYIAPKAWILNIEDECALCAATPVGGQISGSGYEDIETNPAGESEGDDVPMTAKGGDLWGDDEGSSSTGSNLFSDW